MATGLCHNYLAATFFHWGRRAEALQHIDAALTARQSIGDRFGWAVWSFARAGSPQLSTCSSAPK
jgi:hypothetical protein